MTVHKAQGLTLNKIFVELGDKEFTEYSTFVALSRVRCWKDLLIKEIVKNEWMERFRSKKRQYDDLKNVYSKFSNYCMTTLKALGYSEEEGDEVE
uniref:Helicase n=1 Tax=Candidatus Kentrum sp. UNK TaxID=2126344 RepID=A0A451ANX8_9GAMM|nr:MAG: Helicase [Candidatus Kentron sp. UNK]